MEKNGPRNREVCHRRRQGEATEGVRLVFLFTTAQGMGEWQSWIQWQVQSPSDSSLLTLLPLTLNQTNGCKYNNLSFGGVEAGCTKSAGKAFLGQIPLHSYSQWTLFAISTWGSGKKKCLSFEVFILFGECRRTKHRTKSALKVSRYKESRAMPRK